MAERDAKKVAESLADDQRVAIMRLGSVPIDTIAGLVLRGLMWVDFTRNRVALTDQGEAVRDHLRGEQ